MFKKALLAAACVLVSSSGFVSAQDFFFSFDENSRQSTSTVASGTSTGSLFIFADENLDFNQLDLDFSNSNASVASFTGGSTFNANGKFTQFDLLDPNDSNNGPTATDGRLFAVSFLTPGQVPGSGDADFRAGANGFLLAQVDFDIAGDGTTNFEFIPGDLGVVNDGEGQLAVTFGTGSLTVGTAIVPEPSSAILLILGAAGMVVRRKRS